MDSPTILVVDDDPDLLHLIGLRLTTAGYTVVAARSGEEALELFHARPPRAVVTDLRMDGMDGHALFERIHAEAPSIPVIILTAHGTIPEAVAATQRGVFGFLTKPFDGHELLARVAQAVALSPPLIAGAAAAGAVPQLGGPFASMAMAELQRQAHRAAEADEPVLIVGPSGAGKEVLARAIHGAGKRAQKPFLVLRCAELPGGRAEEGEPLTRALVDANGGVLFFDDIDKLLPGAQVRLLPLVREPGLFQAPKPVSHDVRIVAATSQPLDQAIRAGRFRADLYYALSRISLAVPSLAERREDIPLLVAQFAGQHCARAAVARGFAPESLALLQRADWPGNVRQLRTVVEQALALAVTPQVPASLVRRLLREENEKETAAFDEARRAFEHDYLVQLLKTTGGNVARAARVAQRNRTEFYKLLARHGLDPAAFKQSAR